MAHHDINSENIFGQEEYVAPMRIIALDSAKDLGAKIDAHLTQWAQ